MNFKVVFIGLLLLLSVVNCKKSNSEPATNSNVIATPDAASLAISIPKPAKLLIEKIAGLSYQKDDTSCMGFPRLWVDTAQGICVGMVKAIDAADKTLRKPRALVKIPNTDDFILSDMGGWSRKLGKVVKLKKINQHYEIIDLGLNKLSLPHTVAIGPNNKIFIGEDNQIFWFDPLEKHPKKHLKLVSILRNIIFRKKFIGLFNQIFIVRCNTYIHFITKHKIECFQIVILHLLKALICNLFRLNINTFAKPEIKWIPGSI